MRRPSARILPAGIGPPTKLASFLPLGDSSDANIAVGNRLGPDGCPLVGRAASLPKRIGVSLSLRVQTDGWNRACDGYSFHSAFHRPSNRARQQERIGRTAALFDHHVSRGKLATRLSSSKSARPTVREMPSRILLVRHSVCIQERSRRSIKSPSRDGFRFSSGRGRDEEKSGEWRDKDRKPSRFRAQTPRSKSDDLRRRMAAEGCFQTRHSPLTTRHFPFPNSSFWDPSELLDFALSSKSPVNTT